MLKSRIRVTLIVALLLACALPTLAQTVASKQDEPKLIAVLQDAGASRKAKSDACRQLAVIGGKDSIAPLVALLGNEELSHNARYALERNPDPAVDEALRDALGKVKGRPLVGVITSIGVRRDAKAVPALARLLKDSDAVVARAAARATGSIGNTEAAEALEQALPSAAAERKLDVCEGLLRGAERLAADGQRPRAVAIYDRLRELDGPHQVRAGALRGAILTRQRGRQKLLQEYLQSKDYILFSAAVQASQEIPNARITKILLGAMDDLPADNKILVIQALGLRGDKAASPALLDAAKSGEKPVRIAAIEAATELADADAVPVLVRLLDDSDKDIVATAHECLAALPSKEADVAIMALFKDQDAAKRQQAVEMMERRRLEGGASMLLRAIPNTPPEDRPSLIKAAGGIATAEHVPALLDLLSESDKADDLSAVEQALVMVCPKAPDSKAMVAALINRLRKAKPPQEAVLLRVLAAVGGPDALNIVWASLDSTDAGVRATAVRALSTWKTADAARYQLALAKETTDAGERTLALRGYLGLVSRGDLPVERRLVMVRQVADVVQGDGEKRLLLGALGSIDSPEALLLITPYLREATTRQEAASAVITVARRLMRNQNNPKYLPVLIESLEKVTESAAGEGLVSRAKALLQSAKEQGQ